jgi:hypothetical protein
VSPWCVVSCTFAFSVVKTVQTAEIQFNCFVVSCTFAFSVVKTVQTAEIQFNCFVVSCTFAFSVVKIVQTAEIQFNCFIVLCTFAFSSVKIVQTTEIPSAIVQSPGFNEFGNVRYFKIRFVLVRRYSTLCALPTKSTNPNTGKSPADISPTSAAVIGCLVISCSAKVIDPTPSWFTRKFGKRITSK